FHGHDFSLLEETTLRGLQIRAIPIGQGKLRSITSHEENCFVFSRSFRILPTLLWTLQFAIRHFLLRLIITDIFISRETTTITAISGGKNAETPGAAASFAPPKTFVGANVFGGTSI